MKKYASEACLTSAIFNWGVFYKEQVKALKDGTWNADTFLGDMKAGIVGITDISRKVPKDKVAIVKEKEKEFKAGKDDIFKGPIYNNKGKLAIASGKRISHQELVGMTWEVDGVEDIKANE